MIILYLLYVGYQRESDRNRAIVPQRHFFILQGEPARIDIVARYSARLRKNPSS